MNNFGIPLTLMAVILISNFICSCEKDKNQDKPDFRDSLTGSYKCLETFFYFDPIDNTLMNWSIDTVAFGIKIIVEKYQDSSLNIIIGNDSFTGTYDEKKRFTCTDCNGPPDYAKFYNEDSLYVYRKHGVTNHRNYYGKKQ